MRMIAELCNERDGNIDHHVERDGDIEVVCGGRRVLVGLLLRGVTEIVSVDTSSRCPVMDR